MVKVGIPSYQYQKRQGSLGNTGKSVFVFPNFQADNYGTTHCSYDEARNQERNNLHRPFVYNNYALNSIQHALFYRNSQPAPTINGETVPPNMASPSLSQNTSELIAINWIMP